MKNGILILLFASVSKMLIAQPTSLAENLNNGAKINTVIVVALIILVGIFSFLFYLERKIKKMEQD
ncbi:MAG TPA: CcmD family protein [Chitinophagales bacterium]|nr:CcmD family protein [Chitinophagales bacterium]HRB67385.1 CcmD family protein [Chitinophagales bacterium]HRB70003.1 CcmD family protein [Chitinophagales bacterium]